MSQDLSTKETQRGIQEIKEKISKLNRSIYCLECGDDLLLMNGGGNREVYYAMKRERDKLSKELHKLLKGDTNRNA